MRKSLFLKGTVAVFVRDFGRCRRDQRGAIAIIAAIALPMVFAATALAFDIGRQVDTNQATQALADAVTLDAAHFLDGTPAIAPDPYVTITGPSGIPLDIYTQDQVIQYEATESALRNGLDLSSPLAAKDSIAIGVCTAGSAGRCATFSENEECPLSISLPLPATQGGCQPVTGANPTTVVNAVKMSAYGLTNFVFQVGSGSTVRTATAMGPQTACLTGCGTTTTTTSTTVPSSTTTTPTTVPGPVVGVSAFTIGSGLVAANPTAPGNSVATALLDQILSQELGASSASISALSFSGLANASVSVGDIVTSNSTLGGLSQLLDSNISPGTALSAFYNALEAQGSGTSLSAAQQYSTDLGVSPVSASKITASGGVQLCQLISLSGTSACNASAQQLAPVAYAQFNALDYLVGVASLINGQHAISLNLGGALSGSAVTATVYAVSPVAAAGPGPADNAQGASGCPSGYSGTCPVTATDTQAQATISVALAGGVSLSIQANGAQSTATLDRLTCPAPGSVTIDGTNSAATLNPNFVFNKLNFPAVPVSVGANSFTAALSGPFGQSSPAPYTSGNANPNIAIAAPSSLTSLLGLTALTTFNSQLAALNAALAPLLSDLGVNIGYSTVTDNYLSC